MNGTFAISTDPTGPKRRQALPSALHLPAIHSSINWQAKPYNGTFFYPLLTSSLLTLPIGPSCCWANLQRFCLLNSDTSFSTLAPFISPNNSPKNLTGGQTHGTWVMTGAPWLSVWIFTQSSKEGHAYKYVPALPSSGWGSQKAGLNTKWIDLRSVECDTALNLWNTIKKNCLLYNSAGKQRLFKMSDPWINTLGSKMAASHASGHVWKCL